MNKTFVKYNKNLSLLLKKMAVKDQAMRKKAIRTGTWNNKIDKKNTKMLKKIIKKHGWPTIDLVGKKASFNAWLIAQHADHDILFQKNCLKLLKNSENSVLPANVAYLSDRILVNEGKKQLYGTQFVKDKNGVLVLYPIRKPELLRERRRKFDLDTK